MGKVKRLIDEEFAAGSGESLLAELVRATPPLEPGPFDQSRVLARLHAARRSRRVVSVRAGITVLLLTGAAVAAATFEHSWKTRNEAAVLPSIAPLAPVASGQAKVAAPVAASPLPQVDAVEMPPAPIAPRNGADTASAKSKPVARANVSTLAAPFKEGEDPAPVLEAIRALRSEGDPARAGVLLAEYLKAHPHSVLAEDALALSIESALGRHDAHAAGDLAKRYLAQFPNGRYRAYAVRAQAP
jgi:hypothetical protein